MNSVDSGFQQILTAAKERRGDLTVDTMIVSSHLAQMRMFILRRGIEFFAEQDSYGYRKEFLRKVCEHNMLDMKLDSIVDYFLCDGQGLFYFRPSGDNYQLLYFPKENYRAYRDQAGDLNSVVLTYSFNVQEEKAMEAFPMNDPGKRGGKKKYIRLKVFKDRIEQTISDEKIEFENAMGGPAMTQMGQTEVLTNSLGFIPAVEIFNYMDCTGEATGNGEFEWLSNQIMYHDELVKNVRKNLKFYGNPTLISSRPKHDIIEAGDESSFRPTISSQAGFAAMGRNSTRVSEPFGGTSALDGQIKVPRVIANLEPTDRISYLTPDSVSGDQNMYIKQYRQEIRLALGGVDDLDIQTASTAYEIKTLYGRVASTAEKKARALFTYGLCKLFSLMIKHEERMFDESFGVAMGLKKPEIPLMEDFQDPKEYEAANEKFLKQMATYEKKKTDLLGVTLESGEMPNGVTGLIPDGSTKVAWRWMGEVFEDSADEILQNSIVVRNLQEAGVGSIEALKYLFPNKTDEERAAMMSGFPFRVVQQTQQAINSFVGMLGNLYQLPHPQTPDLPLASDPNLDLTGFLYRSLDYLRKELSYSGKYKPSSSDTDIAELSDADKRRSAIGRPVRDEPTTQLPGITDGPGSGGVGPAGFGSGGQPMAGGVSGAERKLEYKQPLPGPGSVLGVSDADTSSQYPGAMGFSAPNPAASPVFGSGDLQSPSFNPNLLGIGSNQPAATASRKPSAKRTRRK
tara:strand:+ start:1568 stop:3784 length:2217 start_codon:yes stop_codon:yes gene_type:complete